MKRLQPFTVPSRFIFTDPDTKYIYEASSKKALMQRIISYRSQNDLEEIEALPTVLENYWCSLPENCSICETMTLRRGWLQYLKGGISLLKNVAFKTLVSQEEAERRADICIGCPHNVFPDKSGFLKWSDDLAYQAVGDNTVKHQKNLGSCEICSCTLKAKVWYGGKLEHHENFPTFCWQHKDNQ